MPRLFTGLEIPADVAQALSMMRGGLPGARWIDPENYNITLRFIGDIDDRLASDIASILDGVKPEHRVSRDEIFGPVLPIITVGSEDEAVALANDSVFGLGASVWTSDRGRGERIAREIESGMVWINDHMFSHGACQCAWGGIKESGLGRTHSKFGLYECVNIKLRVWEGSPVKNAWWHPYDETLGKALRQSAKILYGRPSIRAGALKDGAAPLLKLGARLARDAVRR